MYNNYLNKIWRRPCRCSFSFRLQGPETYNNQQEDLTWNRLWRRRPWEQLALPPNPTEQLPMPTTVLPIQSLPLLCEHSQSTTSLYKHKHKKQPCLSFKTKQIFQKKKKNVTIYIYIYLFYWDDHRRRRSYGSHRSQVLQFVGVVLWTCCSSETPSPSLCSLHSRFFLSECVRVVGRNVLLSRDYLN